MASVEVLVLKDAQGDYYLIPRDSLEQTRVPKKHRAEVEKMVQEGAPGAVDVGEGVELSDEQLEAVTGGLSAFGTLRAPSQLSFQGLQARWGAAPGP